ncbi:AAA domain-containing protein [Actinophytocola sp.]|uniref:DEAD/DEAH box helicase n=1 Tax=Actinophytocola sp. TaxID=1872138 RepID=UPI00389A1CC0
MARGKYAERAEVLEFWRTVEMFSPQKVDRVDREQLVFSVRPGQALPWEARHELARRKLNRTQTWRHKVYLGVYGLEEMFEVISRVFAPDEDSYDERPAGESAVAAFVVDEKGCALVDSAVLSSCAWATGQAVRRRRGRDWLSGFRGAATDFEEALRDAVTDIVPSGDDEAPPLSVPRVLTGADLLACLDAAVGAAGIGSALSCAEIRVKSQIVGRRNADDQGGHDFLNSFIMDDLGKVAERVRSGDVGAALHDYLRAEAEISAADRVDVRAGLGAVLAGTAPQVVPAGRWPSHPEHALAQNQQLAVSAAVGMTGAGIMGVNGPPGTGKTTMLRDLVAALVVARAERLAALANPGKAFTGTKRRWETGPYKRVVSVWRPELTGFEMVVASANNGAVENVTDEIPAESAIDGAWADQAAELAYFPEIGTALLAGSDASAERPAAATSSRAWGMVAARLGNKANRNRFAGAFWYHTPDDPEDDQAWYGLNTVLRNYEQTPPDRSWSAEVEDFRAVAARVAAVRADRAEVYRTVDKRARMDDRLASLRRAVTAAGRRVGQARARREAAVVTEREQAAEAERIARTRQAEAEQRARNRVADAERLVRQGEAEIDSVAGGRRADAERSVRSWEAEMPRRWQFRADYRETRPGLWQRVRTFGAAGRQWAQHDEWLTGQLHDAQEELDRARKELAAAEHEIDTVRRAVAAARQELAEARHVLSAGVPRPVVHHEPLVAARRQVALAEEEITAALRARTGSEEAVQACETEIAALDALLERAAAALGRHYPDATWRTDRERRETVALWTDAEWNRARSELFLAALALHKAFLRHAAQDMRRNLQALMDVLSGDVPDEAPEEAVLAAWQSLFFVVPVVSTTFDSYARMFSHLGREALGWLLIDEAGQATPQKAVGALWRARRAVVVGDPLQLEPVVTLPFRAEQAIRNELGVDEQWLTSRTSVQRLADRLTRLGTWLPTNDDRTWVGVPLTVHRRCDQPMFGIVNTIAYDGLMINGTGTSAGERFAEAYPTLPESKWIDVEGEGARGHWIPEEGRQLDRILATLGGLDGFAMSDVMVIGPFRDIARQLAGRRHQYPGLTAGTIHVAQGKQAEIVVLVLGSAPGKPGARRWASARPNLLNVAISRAKRRLYVIGDRREWSKWPYFTTLAAHLPHTSPR